MIDLVKVKRSGPRGWHFVEKAKVEANPGAYELLAELEDVVEPSAPPVEPARAPATVERRGPGRQAGSRNS